MPLILLFLALLNANLNPCLIAQINADGLLFGAAEIPFPTLTVHPDGTLEELPESTFITELDRLQTGKAAYRNLALTLKLRPYLYDHMIPFIPSMWASWGGDRIPYVGEWTLDYEILLDGRWESVHESGSINPQCGIAHAPNLAADADFNGRPRAFWNNHVETP